MTTLLYTHEACFNHDPGRMHPESPARLKAVLAALDGKEFEELDRREAPQATREQLARVHPEAYIDRVFAAIPESGYVGIDGDTTISPGSGEAALRAAGAACAAVDAVMAEEGDNAFCAVRPPGHHAEPEIAMGFCLFNTIAVAALHARHAHRLSRIAVVDFDVHHGNGTQAAFWNDPDLLFASTHQAPLYPGTGRPEERGVAGNIVNIPLRPMSGSKEFRQAMSDGIFPKLANFQPELILVSAGFDAHEEDPLASLRFHEDDFAWATSELLHIAESACAGRLISTLEGGYDTHALGRCSAAHVRTLINA